MQKLILGLVFALGCANADRDATGTPTGDIAPPAKPDSGEGCPVCPTIPDPQDPMCPVMPPTQPDACDPNLVCHGGRCYARCCTDTQCASDESCRWGVCKPGKGWSN